MLRFIFHRLWQSLLVLWAVVTLVFFMIKAVPGDPFQSDKACSAFVKEQNRKIYWLDKPLHVQYFRYMGNALRGELATSMKFEGRSVVEIITHSFPVSLKLGLLSLAVAMLLGTPLGILAALRQNTWVDTTAMSLALIGICLPGFVLGPLLALIVGLKLNLVNVAGVAEPTDWILPSLTVGIFYAAYFARLTRAGLLEILSQDYIRTARAKGLPGWKIVLRHTLRGGLMPMLSFLGPALAGIVSGSFIVESVFRIPGLGQHFVEAAVNKDFSLVLGTASFYCVLLVGANLLVDILQVLLNPRLRTTL
jgi:oligopeptide transport system permease protein